jgi:hypothetical protein
VCTPAWISGFQPDLFELIADIFDRKLFSFRPRCAPFKLIRRENLNVREYAVRRDRLQRWFQAQWQFVDREKRSRSGKKDCD